jgi:hypothetical protein
MDQPSPEPWTLRVGEVEADLRIGEVGGDGSKVPSQDTPFRALALLLARPRLKERWDRRTL